MAKKRNSKKDAWEALTNDFVEVCKSCDTFASIKEAIGNEIFPKYGRGPRISLLVDDLAESVALKMGVSQD